MTDTQNKILVTGGAGFIGSNFVLRWIETVGTPVVNLDLLTYAGNPENLASLESDKRYQFVRGDICDAEAVAARSTSIAPAPSCTSRPKATSIVPSSSPAPSSTPMCKGHSRFLSRQGAIGSTLERADQAAFRFLHVSTDEVYGTLAPDDPAFSETTPYAPNSPYAASKAASDHLARAYFHTYELPVLTTNCSNNYGPFQFPEKLIPLDDSERA